MRVCPGVIGWVVVGPFARMMYFFGLHYIIVIDR